MRCLCLLSAPHPLAHGPSNELMLFPASDVFCFVKGNDVEAEPSRRFS